MCWKILENKSICLRLVTRVYSTFPHMWASEMVTDLISKYPCDLISEHHWQSVVYDDQGRNTGPDGDEGRAFAEDWEPHHPAPDESESCAGADEGRTQETFVSWRHTLKVIRQDALVVVFGLFLCRNQGYKKFKVRIWQNEISEEVLIVSIIWIRYYSKEEIRLVGIIFALNTNLNYLLH